MTTQQLAVVAVTTMVVVVFFTFLLDCIYCLFSFYCEWLPRLTAGYLRPYQTKSANLCTFDFQSGDLLLFSCENPYSINSLLQKTISKGPFTHIGMVIRDTKTGSLRCWELDKSQQEGKSGSHFLCLSNLHNRIFNYRGTVCVRPLMHNNKNIMNNINDDGNTKNSSSIKNNISNSGSSSSCSSRRHSIRRRSAQEDDDICFYDCVDKILQNEFIKQHHYRSSFWIDSYDRFLNALHPPMPIKRRSGVDRAWICTDLIKKTYSMAGVLSDKRNKEETLWPCEFSSMHPCDLGLSPHWYFAPEIILKKPSSPKHFSVN